MTTAQAAIEPAIRWGWSAALRGAILAIPAAAVAPHDAQHAAVLAVGLVPAASIPLPPTRRGRLKPAAVGVLAGASMFVGGVLAIWPPLAVAGIFVLAVLAARLAVGRALGAVALSLCLPLVGIGFSFGDVETAATLALVIALGSAYGLAISLLWPPGSAVTLPPVYVPPPRAVMVRFGYQAGTAGAICAAVGFALDLDHVGWATGAALLVMRPAPRLQEYRSLARVVDVIVGATVAIALVTADAPAWAYSVAILVAVVCVTATAGSRWYVMPAFTTFLVFVMLLVEDPGDAQSRFWERVLETALGVGVAAVVVVVATAYLIRPKQDR
ncbi:FUSC family protein [uncultured Nocardioides sp.]|uniref:FUSC family protein n=1 Tax=uncultured Nocardioides sp. TaxID=198441 RepID=UPI00261F50EC|nr:FUSC family protein [uncultured Nocardioides sp.]